jgi:soluble lytic murein transglycosylase
MRGVIALVLLLLVAPASALGREQERSRFQAAWRVAQTGANPADAARGLEDYPLYPYLAYERLRRQGDKANERELAAFIADWGDTLPGQRLRSSTLSRYGRAGRHDEFLALYVDGDGGLDLRCQAFVARQARQSGFDAQGEALAIFAALDADRPACAPVLSFLRGRGELGEARVSARIDAALAAGHIALAQKLLAELPASRRPAKARHVLARRDPAVALAQAQQWPVSADSATAAAIALGQWARKGAAEAEKRYQALAQRLPFSADSKAIAEREIARYGAVERLPQAADWLARLAPEAFDENLREWQVRYHLRRTGYAEALAGIESMPEAQAGSARWRYTRGRLLELLGRESEAGPHFAAAAREANFHGFLAADRLAAPYAICPLDGQLDAARRSALLAEGGVQRALEWQALGEHDRARAEWFWQIARLDAGTRREAGLLAAREGLAEWAIFTLNGPEHLRQYEARFPLLHLKTVENEAARAALPTAYVLALIRAESAWNPSARSHAGARGLMQLMPQTAANVARSLGLRAEPLNDPAHNIRLGTTYLGRRVKELDGNVVLATGAYNAGLGAVRRWLAEPLPPWDLWIETVPYKETREYIPRVLAFSVLYDWRIDGRPERISARIPGLGAAAGPAPVVCPAG